MRSFLLADIVLTGALLAACSNAAPLDRRGLNWEPCEDVEVTTVCANCECATLAVPLDYATSSSRIINLPLLRVPAPEKPSNKSILFNFGGPGEEARFTLASAAPTLLKWDMKVRSRIPQLTIF
jgi:hypothetical protein